MICKWILIKKNSLKEIEVIWLLLFFGKVIKNEKKMRKMRK